MACMLLLQNFFNFWKTEEGKGVFLKLSCHWAISRDNNNNHIERCSSRFWQYARCATNYLQHEHSSGQGVIVCKSRVAHQAIFTCSRLCTTWCKGTAQLLCLTGFESRLFFILLAEPLNRWRRRGKQRKALATSFRLLPEFWLFDGSQGHSQDLSKFGEKIFVYMDLTTMNCRRP